MAAELGFTATLGDASAPILASSPSHCTALSTIVCAEATLGLVAFAVRAAALGVIESDLAGGANDTWMRFQYSGDACVRGAPG